jgi:putative transcriptional regulator
VKDKMFEELVASVQEGADILRGKTSPSRTFHVKTPDVQRIRARYNLSQNKFAELLGISPSTLRNWEQGRRTPVGPARVLLQIADNNPDALLNIVANARKPARGKAPKPTKKARKTPAIA